MTTVARRALEATAVGGLALTIAATLHAVEKPKIERKVLEEHIEYLASDELAGRGNGDEGLRLAAAYLAKQFETIGLEPAGERNGFYQTFRIELDKEIGRHTEVALQFSERKRPLEYPSDYVPMTFSSAGDVSAPVVFVGYGVTAPEHDYDDYRGVDVEGKIVMLLRYVPGQALERGPFEKDGWHATFVRKAENAISHGAAAIMIVNGPLHHREDRLVPFGVNVGTDGLPVPAMHLGRVHAEEILEAQGLNLRDLQQRIDERLAPRSFELEGVSVELSIDVRRTIEEVSNVLGYLPPTDGRTREHIVIGAHYDHLGLGKKGSRERTATGQIHNGADDNASGVAGMIELARIFSELEHRPRGILFAAFAGEELGLRGSYHYTENPTRRLEDTIAMLNLDMIGRLRHNRIFIGGVELVPSLAEAVAELTEDAGLTYSGRFSAADASDHASFIRAGVPALLLFTGLHGDYHKPTDDPQFVNYEGVERVLRFSYNVSDFLLRTDERPVLRVSRGGDIVSRRRAAGETAYFGIGVDNNFTGEGVRFSYVEDGGPAARAGLQAGDVLLELDGRVVSTGRRATALLRQKRPGETINAKVRRNNRILEVKVQLSRWP